MSLILNKYGNALRRLAKSNMKMSNVRGCANHKGLLRLEDMPRPAAIPLLGTAPQVFLASLQCRIHKYVDKQHKKLGRIFRDKLGPVNTVVIADPGIMRDVFINHEGKYPYHIVPEPWTLYNEKFQVKRGLFFMNGEEWLETRRIMNKLLLKPNNELWIQESIAQVSNLFIARWIKHCSSAGYEPNLEVELYKLSLDVILAVMLGSTYSANFQRFDDLLKEFATSVHGIFQNSSKMYMLPAKFYERLYLPSWNGFVKSVQKSLAYGEQLVHDVYKLNDIGDGLMSRMIKEGLDEEMVSRILIDMIIAAGDTTSFTMQWMLYLLSKNQAVILDFLRTKPNSEEEIMYATWIIKETMRLYPAAAFISRILSEDAVIGGYMVPKGTVLVMSVYTSSRDEKYFSNPLSFEPLRWNRSISTENTPMASIPFAMGSRSCIGRKIAVTQMKQIIIKILRNFQMTILNKGDVDDIMQMVVRPAKTIRISLEPVR